MARDAEGAAGEAGDAAGGAVEACRALAALVARWGGQTAGLDVAARAGERGVVATRAFAAGERVLVVPPALLVPSAALAGAPEAAPLRALRGEDAAPALLARWLLDAGGRAPAEGPVGAYRATLPTALGHFPLHYPPDRRAALRGLSLAERVRARRAWCLDEHAALVADGVDIAADAWLAARTLATSRSFACDGGSALVPFGDLLNHALDPGTCWTCDPAAGFVVEATRALPAGAEVCLSYGTKPNAALLLAYGFTVRDNPLAEVELTLGPLGPCTLGGPDEDAEVARIAARVGGLPEARALLARACRTRLASLPPDTPAERADAGLADLLAVRADERRTLRAALRAAGDGTPPDDGGSPR